MTPEEFKSYAKSMERVICSLAQDVKNAPTLEELMDALTCVSAEVQSMFDEAEAYFDEEQEAEYVRITKLN